MSKKFLIYFFIILVSVNTSFAQTFFSKTKYQLETGTYLSTSGITPFWLRSNQYGIVPLSSPILTFRGSAHKEYDSTKNENQKLKKFGYGYSFWGVANIGKQSRLLLPEAYLKVRYGAFEIYGGRRREVIGLVDTTLTSGSYIWAGNALPMPKLQISIPNYTSIIGHGLISIKGAFAHGWFDNDRPITKYGKLHQKSFYTRIGKNSWKIRMYAGFNHNVQWGGESPFYSINGKLPDGFKNYINAVTGKRGAITNSPQTSDFDANRVGNHLGTIDIGMDIKINNTKVFLYRQSIYEDGSLFYLNNITDGLNGISIKFNNTQFIKKIGFEYLNTKNQGGNVFAFSDDAPAELRGKDSYFSNSQFADGWTYKNNIIGTPFIQNYNLNFKASNELKDFFIENNRIKLFNVSALGSFSKDLFFSLRNSFSINYGTYINPTDEPLQQISTLLSVSKSNFYFKNITFNLNLSFDTGNLYTSSFGTYIRIIKQL